MKPKPYLVPDIYGFVVKNNRFFLGDNNSNDTALGGPNVRLTERFVIAVVVTSVVSFIATVFVVVRFSAVIVPSVIVDRRCELRQVVMCQLLSN